MEKITGSSLRQLEVLVLQIGIDVLEHGLDRHRRYEILRAKAEAEAGN